MPKTVLLVSARMGAGHDGAARELARRVEERGHRAVVVDFLDAFWRPLSSAWKQLYLVQLRRYPESYERSYQLFYRRPELWEPFTRFERALSGRRTMAWVRDARPDVVVSTYSFATLVLGRLREEGRLGCPAVNFITDFGVHPRAVHPGVDLNLAIHPVAADAARRFVSTPVIPAGPAVAPRFSTERPSRAEARASLGLAADERVVLVTAGSWGVGPALEEAVAALCAAPGRPRVVTACASDTALLRRLQAKGLGTPIGWTDQMPAYVAAADVVVENAGGLSSLEAFAARVPIVSYKPIPGHGRDNIGFMVRAGVTTNPADPADLVRAVSRLAVDGPERRAQVAAAAAMFAEDPVDRILAVAEGRWDDATAPVARPAADPSAVGSA